MYEQSFARDSACIVVAAFDGREDAHDALHALYRARRDTDLQVRDVVELRRRRDGRVYVAETASWGSTGRAMAVGGIAGAAIGVLTGGVGWLLVGGSAVSGLSARLRDTGFDNLHLRRVADRLTIDAPELLVVCDLLDTDQCTSIIRTHGCRDIYVAALDPDTTRELSVLDAVDVPRFGVTNLHQL
jgi:uncharacterized membrane protein